MDFPLEDHFEDVVAKAQKGLGVTHRQLAEAVDLPLETLRNLKAETCPESALESIADSLGLALPGLERHHRRKWHPPGVPETGVAFFPEPFFEGVVNAYAVPTGEGILIFDTGVEGAALLAYLQKENRSPAALYLTHLHPDHIGGMERLREAFPEMPVFVPDRESGSPPGALPPPRLRRWGSVEVEARATPGHSPGGTTYVLRGGQVPLAVVGDALFAGSVGGCASDYAGALEAIRREILSLPPETVLLPGHGPPTTVEHERQWNPFFPA